MNMKTISHEEVVNRFIGEPGTENRIRFENELKAEILAHQFKELRKKKHLTQSQLAEKLGMEKGQISKIENGKFNLTLATINKIASALGARVNFVPQNGGEVADSIVIADSEGYADVLWFPGDSIKSELDVFVFCLEFFSLYSFHK